MTNLIAQCIAVLLSVESGGELFPDRVIGDGGAAVGCLQMHHISVLEANRLEAIAARKENRPARTWTDVDRLNRQSSIEMCKVILAHHWRRGFQDVRSLCYRWQMPYGRETAAYRDRVDRVLRSQDAREGPARVGVCHDEEVRGDGRVWGGLGWIFGALAIVGAFGYMLNG